MRAGTTWAFFKSKLSCGPNTLHGTTEVNITPCFWWYALFAISNKRLA